MGKLKVIGLTGFARSGKDSFFKLSTEYLKSHGIVTKRYALADALKADINEFLIDKIGISAFSDNVDEKKIIRPLLVEYGRCKRVQSDGKYWTGLLEKSINKDSNDIDIAFVTDVRYALYNEDEIFWLQNDMEGELIHISQYRDINGSRAYLPSPNGDESENDPILRKHADLFFEWEHVMQGDTPNWEIMKSNITQFIDNNNSVFGVE